MFQILLEHKSPYPDSWSWCDGGHFCQLKWMQHITGVFLPLNYIFFYSRDVRKGENHKMCADPETQVCGKYLNQAGFLLLQIMLNQWVDAISPSKRPLKITFFFSATHCFDKKGAEKKKVSSASALSKCVIRSLDQNWITIAPSSWRQQTCRSSLWNLVDTFVLSAGVAALHKLRSSQCNVPHAELFFPLRASSRQTEGLSQEKLCFR